MSFSRPLATGLGRRARAHARCKAQVSGTAVQHFCCTVHRRRTQKLTRLTEDEPTSKVHARMTQPTIIFANLRLWGEGDNRRERGVARQKIKHLSNSRSPASSSQMLSERPSLLVWRKSAAETEMLRSVQRKPVPIGWRRHYDPSHLTVEQAVRAGCSSKRLPAMLPRALLGCAGRKQMNFPGYLDSYFDFRRREGGSGTASDSQPSESFLCPSANWSLFHTPVIPSVPDPRYKCGIRLLFVQAAMKE